MSGYSGTPLPKKLGIKSNEQVVLINAPTNYHRILGKLPPGVSFLKQAKTGVRFAHLFTTKRSDLSKELRIWRIRLAAEGMLWVSWPKKSSGVMTDVTEDVIREVALPLGFVDIKVCAVDETWSGLKLVVRCENRQLEK